MAATHGYSDAERYERLRRSARDLLDKGATPRNGVSSLSVDALQLLYERASNPESAADALRLLHELQTHQVELDLLYEQLLASEYEIAEELAHYKSLFDGAPAAYVIVANDGVIIEGNQAAEILFNEFAATLIGQSLGSLLAPGQDDAVAALIESSGPFSPGTKRVSAEFPDHRRVRIQTRHSATGDSVLMIITEAATNSAGS